MNKKKAIAENIKAAIKDKGLSRRQFADLMGVPPCIVTRWLKGDHNFTISTLFDIEEKLNHNLLNIMAARKVTIYKVRTYSKAGGCI